MEPQKNPELPKHPEKKKAKLEAQPSLTSDYNAKPQ